MDDLTEADAYKQIIELAETILNSLDLDSELFGKYLTLKKNILNKVIRDDAHAAVLTAHKILHQRTLHTLDQFETEIEATMNKAAFQRGTLSARK